MVKQINVNVSPQGVGSDEKQVLNCSNMYDDPAKCMTSRPCACTITHSACIVLFEFFEVACLTQDYKNVA
jgi:hypothetical protein